MHPGSYILCGWFIVNYEYQFLFGFVLGTSGMILPFGGALDFFYLRMRMNERHSQFDSVAAGGIAGSWPRTCACCDSRAAPTLDAAYSLTPTPLHTRTQLVHRLMSWRIYIRFCRSRSKAYILSINIVMQAQWLGTYTGRWWEGFLNYPGNPCQAKYVRQSTCRWLWGRQGSSMMTRALTLGELATTARDSILLTLIII